MNLPLTSADGQRIWVNPFAVEHIQPRGGGAAGCYVTTTSGKVFFEPCTVDEFAEIVMAEMQGIRRPGRSSVLTAVEKFCGENWRRMVVLSTGRQETPRWVELIDSTTSRYAGSGDTWGAAMAQALGTFELREQHKRAVAVQNMPGDPFIEMCMEDGSVAQSGRARREPE